jgi:SAM-dependent methyltransferase
MDKHWEEIANNLYSIGVRSAVGPLDFEVDPRRINFASYHTFDETSNPDVWILHRGQVEQWPQSLGRILSLYRFSIVSENEVFTVIKKRKLPQIGNFLQKADPNTKDFLQICARFKEIGFSESNASRFSKIDSINKYKIDDVVRRLADVQGWEAETQPNTSSSGEMLRDLRILKSNVKTLAWRIEQLDAPDLSEPASGDITLQTALEASKDSFVVSSRICRSSDIYSDWHRLLSRALKSSNYKLRKIWEWTFTIKALHSLGYLNGASSGLGFGCGTEPLASCFANYVNKILVTDAPPSVIAGKGWSDTNQHAASLEQAKYEWLAERHLLDKVMDFEYVDMNAIPGHLFGGFDFVWSSCALEHLGSKALGLKFIVDSAKCLKPGGIAIHTTEYDLSNSSTIDNWQTVLFNEQDFSTRLPELLLQASKEDPSLDFEIVQLDCARGTGFIDGYVDIPPYSYHWDVNESFGQSLSGLHASGSSVSEATANSLYQYPQMNLSVDGFPCTSIAIVVKRK